MQENNAKNTTPKKIVLIDGMSVIYRSYYGLQQTNLSNRKNDQQMLFMGSSIPFLLY